MAVFGRWIRVFRAFRGGEDRAQQNDGGREQQQTSDLKLRRIGDLEPHDDYLEQQNDGSRDQRRSQELKRQRGEALEKHRDEDHEQQRKQYHHEDGEQRDDDLDQIQDGHQEPSHDENPEEQRYNGHVLTLSNLDIYNTQQSPIAWLPEELLLCILHCLDDDIVALYCLRRVSRTFRRIIYEPSIWKLLFPSDMPSDYTENEDPLSLPASLLKQLGQLIHRDHMCDRCNLWCDVPVAQESWAGSTEILSFNDQLETHTVDCKFNRKVGRFLYCEGCSCKHSPQAFSSSDQESYKEGRRCLAHQGAVQLCEHIHIPWVKIETHISYWQQRKPGDWQACFDDFKIECHDPSHDTRCTAEEAPTWPRALLQSAWLDKNRVVLNLEWQPHSGLNAFTRTIRNQVPASELGALFQKYQDGAAGILLPSYPSVLLEMICFDPAKCSYLYYETGGDKILNGTHLPAQGFSFHHDSFFEERRSRKNIFTDDRFGGYYGCAHRYQQVYGLGYNSGIVRMGTHWSKSGSVCLVTTYQRDVLVCFKTDDSKIYPTHHWFHAMDPDTYPRPHGGLALPICKDKSCMNYYRRPRITPCYNCPGSSVVSLRC